MQSIGNWHYFPFDIRQFCPLWTIPASIEAVIKYHNPDSEISQIWLVDEFRKVRRDFSSISFSAICNLVLKPKLGSSFEFKRDNYPDFGNWVTSVQNSIKQSLPLLISYRRSNSIFHVNVVVGFDETNLFTYDPDPNVNFPSQLSMQYLEKTRTGDVLLIKPHETPQV